MPRPVEEVFAFFSEAKNLEAITPFASFRDSQRAAEDRTRFHLHVEYDLRVHGLPVRWKTLIAEFEPARRFVDVQLHGPYRLWRHEHRFSAVEAGTDVSDTVEFVLPHPPFGELAAQLVARDVTQS